MSYLSAVTDLIYALLAKLGLKKPVADLVVHVLVVFAAGAAAVLVKSATGSFQWSVLAAAGLAGVSAVVHYAAGLVPGPKPPAPPA